MSAMHRWTVRAAVLVCWIVCAVLLQSCQDYDEINELAIVNMIGLDRNDDGIYIGYYQVINPPGVAVQKGGAAKATVYTYKFEGKALSDIAFGASKMLPRKLFTQHFQAYIISERLAKHGLRELMNFLETDYARRKATDLFITKQPMDKFMYTYVPLEKLPGRDIRSIQRLSREGNGSVEKHTRMNDLLEHYDSAKLIAVTMIDLNESKPLPTTRAFEMIDGNLGNYFISGTGLMLRGKLVGAMNSEEAKTYHFLNGTVTSLPVDIRTPEGKTVELRVYQRPKMKKRLELANGKPTLHIRLEVKLAISNNNQNEKMTSDNIAKLQNGFNELMKKKSYALLEKGKKNNLDLLHIEEQMKRKRGSAWEEWKTEPSSWKTAAVNVSVDSTITKIGTMTNPYKEE